MTVRKAVFEKAAARAEGAAIRHQRAATGLYHVPPHGDGEPRRQRRQVAREGLRSEDEEQCSEAGPAGERQGAREPAPDRRAAPATNDSGNHEREEDHWDDEGGNHDQHQQEGIARPKLWHATTIPRPNTTRDPRTMSAVETSTGPLLPLSIPDLAGLRILSVGEAARAIASTVRADEQLRDLWVEGEVGRVTISSAGHAYFTLKDERAQLQCVWFRDDRVRSPFQPQTGLRVVAHGGSTSTRRRERCSCTSTRSSHPGVGDLATSGRADEGKAGCRGPVRTEREARAPVTARVVAVVSSPTGAGW